MSGYSGACAGSRFAQASIAGSRSAIGSQQASVSVSTLISPFAILARVAIAVRSVSFDVVASLPKPDEFGAVKHG